MAFPETHLIQSEGKGPPDKYLQYRQLCGMYPDTWPSSYPYLAQEAMKTEWFANVNIGV